MVDPKKIIKGVKAVKKATKKKPMSPKQKTYQIRGAEQKREKELDANGGRASAKFIADLRKKTFPEQYK
jgi:hypothetical protein